MSAFSRDLAAWLRRIATVVLPLKIGTAVLFLALGCMSGAPAQDFFKGREVNLYVGSGAGGPYDAYARLVGRHFGKYLPGHPSVVVQNMPGASGRRLINFMTNVAPK